MESGTNRAVKRENDHKNGRTGSGNAGKQAYLHDPGFFPDAEKKDNGVDANTYSAYNQV